MAADIHVTGPIRLFWNINEPSFGKLGGGMLIFGFFERCMKYRFWHYYMSLLGIDSL